MTYPGPMPAGPGIVFHTICYTRGTARAVRIAWGIGFVLLGAALGGLGAVVISFIVTNIEPVTKIISFIGGVIVGGGIGLAYFINTLRASLCTCPAGVEAFCLKFIYMIPFAGGPAVAVPPFVIPDPTSCATLVPAGCP